MASKFEKNPKLTLFIITTVTLFLLILGFEKILGATIIGKSDKEEIRHIRLREHSPFLNHTHAPSASYLKSVDGLEDKTYTFTTDKNGYIEPTPNHSNPDYTIAFIGGSTTECMYVDEGLRFPYLTGKILEKESLKINTINSGVSGNDSLHSINIFLNKVIANAPDMAVLMHNVNDLSILIYEQSYWNDNFYRSPLLVEDRSMKSIIKQLLPNSYEFLFRLKTNLVGEIDEFKNIRGQKITLNEEKILKKFRANLIIFINIAKAKEIKPVLMTQANRFTEKPDKIIYDNWSALEKSKISYEQYRSLYRAMNEEIRQVAQENNILLVDLAKEVPQTREYMIDPVHLNGFGSKYVSKLIAKSLKDTIKEDILK